MYQEKWDFDMKISEHEPRQIIREEFMQGVPEFMLRQASNEFVDKISQHIQKFVATRAENPTHAREMLQSANETLNSLNEKVYALVEEKLWEFLHTT